ncbi:MAG: glycosyltransferase involved in cell wall biosynthesis [Candidatus Omnitrophota bacterium]|jgi:glycosyltransferase involved in cell wall biosynthesis
MSDHNNIKNDDQKFDVSVIIITKNEEGRIRDCIKSVEWAKEIIVVDDESTDETKAICSELGAKVYERRMDVEGAHRNYSYGLATCAWVLSLDADERVSDELAKEIKDITINGSAMNGYGIPRKNYIGEYWVQHGGMYPSRQLKFFKRGVFTYEAEGEVHPRAIMHDPRGELNGDIIHYTYRDFSDCIAKLDRHTDLEAKKWFREKRKVGILNILRKTVDRFAKSYFKKKGHKDGVIGLFMAVNSGMYQFLSYIKYREMVEGPAKVPA